MIFMILWTWSGKLLKTQPKSKKFKKELGTWTMYMENLCLQQLYQFLRKPTLLVYKL